MAHTATATQGFEVKRYTTEHEILWLPGDPGVTYTKGDAVKRSTTDGSAGLIIADTDATVPPIGIVQKTVVCPANTQAFPLPGNFDSADESAATKCLVPVKMNVPAGVPICWATFASHKDDTVITYSASSLYIAATTGHGTDDYPNGGLVYVYEGTGKGEVNVVDDYDHADGAAALLVQLHRKFNSTLDATSKYIVLAGESAATSGMSTGARMDKDHNNVVANDGYNDGAWMIYASWPELTTHLHALRVPVINVAALAVA